MNKNRYYISSGVGVIVLGVIALNVQAADLSTGMLAEQNQLRSLAGESNARQSFTHKGWDNRNPFDTSMLKDVVVSQAAVSHYDLEGIFIGSLKPSVIINGRVLGVGDRIYEATIQEIRIDSVVLVNGQGKETVLSLKK